MCPFEVGLAAFACRSDLSRGRQIDELRSAGRSDFQRDRDRVIHSSAFRRLALKTQVFLPEEGDHYRTRLTHSIEVAQIARTIARALRLNEDLTEALALAHDIGHPPFGHTGEDALDRSLKPAGGFDHNEQTLRIVTQLERRYPAFDGLNLTWEMLEGLVKRNGPLVGAEGTGPGPASLPEAYRRLDAQLSLDLSTYPSGEAQAAAVADDIAYNAHDLEDGLEAGLFTLDDVRTLPMPRTVLDELATAHPGLDESRTIRGLTRRMIGLFVEDCVAESDGRLRAAGVVDIDALRRLGHPVLALSPAFDSASRDVKAFLFRHMYRHPRLLRVRSQAADIVCDLADLFIRDPGALPPPWAEQALAQSDFRDRMRVAGNYVAALTDRGAIGEHRRRFRATPDLR